MKKKHRELYRPGGILIVMLSLLCVIVPSVWCAQSDYNGPYYGYFSGDDSGVWVAWLEAGSESVFLSYSNSNQGDAGWLSYWGESGTVGNFRVSSTLVAGSSVNADVDSSNGTVSGTWSNSGSGDNGTLSGNSLVSSAYAGTYSGTFGGDSSGTWTMTIASNGYVTGVMTSSDGSSSFEGGCHPDGYVLLMGTDVYNNDFGVFASISGSNISGSWESESGEEGSVSSGGSSDGDSDDGGGGCFLLSLSGP